MNEMKSSVTTMNRAAVMHRMLASAALLASMLFGGVAQADQNILPNGDFSDSNQITGWTLVGFGTQSWNADDADTLAGSGSLEVTTDVSGGLSVAHSSCFA